MPIDNQLTSGPSIDPATIQAAYAQWTEAHGIVSHGRRLTTLEDAFAAGYVAAGADVVALTDRAMYAEEAASGKFDLEQRIKALVAALRFYADAEQYVTDVEGYCGILGDAGNSATDVLNLYDEDVTE